MDLLPNELDKLFPLAGYSISIFVVHSVNFKGMCGHPYVVFIFLDYCQLYQLFEYYSVWFIL